MTSVRQRRESAVAYSLLLPSMIGVALFLLVPVVIVIGLSFMRWDLISDPTWVGLANYRSIFSSVNFRNSVVVSILFTALTIPATIALGLLLALALNRRLPGSGALRVIYVLPWVCAPLTLGVVWRWVFDPTNGAINAILGRRVEWLTDLTLAMPSVAFVQVWSTIGYVSLFFLAGLQQIPQPIYEASRLDGAGPVRTLWRKASASPWPSWYSATSKCRLAALGC